MLFNPPPSPPLPYQPFPPLFFFPEFSLPLSWPGSPEGSQGKLLCVFFILLLWLVWRGGGGRGEKGRKGGREGGLLRTFVGGRNMCELGEEVEGKEGKGGHRWWIHAGPSKGGTSELLSKPWSFLCLPLPPQSVAQASSANKWDFNWIRVSAAARVSSRTKPSSDLTAVWQLAGLLFPHQLTLSQVWQKIMQRTDGNIISWVWEKSQLCH